jgi:hypothetical protein
VERDPEVAAQGRMVSLWDAAGNRPLGPLLRHTGKVEVAFFLGNGR